MMLHFFDYFECPQCGFDSVQLATFMGPETCPMCEFEGETIVRMERRPARAADDPVGRDVRVEQSWEER
jgi:rubredoxin